MSELTKRMNPLNGSACQEMKQKFAENGIELEGQELVDKTLEYLQIVSKNVTNGVQYFTAKELAWDQIS